MARPRKDEEAPSAHDRIIEEFWKLYERKPLERISVKEVCGAAGVNKTTFYYHFDDLRAVLDEIERNCLPVEAPSLLFGLFAAGDKPAHVAEAIAHMGPRFERYCMLLSSRGDPGFARRAKAEMTSIWCKRLGVGYDELAPETRLAMMFAMGGAMSIFADHGDGAPFDSSLFATVILDMLGPFAQKMQDDVTGESALRR